ncbi:embryonic protein UVS.2-like [Ambystoma mexicanum]|uniref:embryonic protein UVS.2-like n=1 Tax=Ambystoma mexicanum TaxID=8296 RepID=UPI0037E9AD3D
MDGRVWVIFTLWMVNSCFTLPVQIYLETPGKDDAQHRDQVESSDMFQIFNNENAGGQQLIREGDIAVLPGRSAVKCAGNNCFWPKSSNGIVTIPYTISSAYSTANTATIVDAMQEYATLTCIRFEPRTAETNYLQIQPGTGCWSYIGKIGGAQQISLTGSCMTIGAIQHELHHALGFFHEQNRSDRDDYVTIMTQYISPGDMGNFIKIDTDNLGLEYDYLSLMHYPSIAFSNTSGKATIIPKPDPNVPIGQRNGLSNLDLAKVNTLYQCGVCSSRYSTVTGTLVSSNYPSAYPNNASCVYLIRVPFDKVYLKFDAFDLQSSTDCTSDYVKIYDGGSDASPVLLNRACGTGKLPPFTSSGSVMLVEFKTDGSTTASGFKASFSTAQCGGSYLSAPGTITSPNYPSNYPPGRDCTYIIMAPVGYKISLVCSDFHLENDVNCMYDYLSIFDGPDYYAKRIGSYCGSSLFPPVRSTGNSLLLQFHSDGGVQFAGFQVSYTFVSSP